MTDQINPGDLVMVVKPTPCCGHSSGLGRVFRVSEVSRDLSRCTRCHAVFISTLASGANTMSGVLTSMLKKLNPPEREEIRETTKELEVV